jgi:hypothetical protein
MEPGPRIGRRLLRLGAVVAVLVLRTPAWGAPPTQKDLTELARYDAAVKPSDRRHWAFQPVRKPPVPSGYSIAPAEKLDCLHCTHVPFSTESAERVQ